MKSLGTFKIRPEIKAQENAAEKKLVFESDWGHEYVLHFNLNDCFHVISFFILLLILFKIRDTENQRKTSKRIEKIKYTFQENKVF